MKSNTFKKIFLALFAFALSALCTEVSATHIIGGELHYECLGGNGQYRVFITIYRDCDNGIADFDDPLFLGIFDEDTTQMEFQLPLGQRDTLTPIVADSCLIPPNICVETTEYVIDVTLPEPVGGYYFSYVECCRNDDIVNIINDEQTGSVFLSYLSNEKYLECEDGLDFNDWPPLAICVDEPIDWDHSVIQDRIPFGHTVEYSLCRPLSVPLPVFRQDSTPILPGQSFQEILERYDSVEWEIGFNEDLMLNGAPDIAIEESTGFITGVPVQLGRYVIGVCVEEYNVDGDLVSFLRRDFQYNVTDCDNTNAEFMVDSVFCYYDGEPLEIFVDNKTGFTNDFLWIVENGTDTLRSTEVNPVFRVPDTGAYNITLISKPGTACADTSDVLTTKIVLTELMADFDIDIEDCNADSTNVTFTDQSSAASYEMIDRWEWTLDGVVVSTQPDFTIFLAGSRVYNVVLTVWTKDGCMDEEEKLVEVRPLDFDPLDDQFVCEGDTICLNPNADLNFFYTWTNGQGDTFSLEPNPCILIQSDTCLFLTVSSSDNVGCTFQDTICLEFVSEEGTPDFECNIIDRENNIVEFTCNGANCDIYEVCFNDPENPDLCQGGFPIIYDYPDSMETFCAIFVPDEGALKCVGIDSVKCEGNFTDQCCDYAFEYEVLDCTDSLKIEFRIDTICAVDSIVWEIEGETYRGAEVCDTFFKDQVPIDLSYTIYFEDERCPIVTDTLEVEVDTFDYPELDTIVKCEGDTVFLNPGFNSEYEYRWSPEDLVSDPEIGNPSACPESTTTFTVIITDPETGCYVTRNVVVEVIDLPDVDFPDEFVICDSSDIFCVPFIPGFEYEWSCFPDFSDVISTDTCINPDPGKDVIYIRLTDENGCEIIDSIEINNQIIVVNYDEVIRFCEGDTVKIQFEDVFGNILEWIYDNPDIIVVDEGDGCIFVTSERDVMLTITVMNEFCEFTFSILLDVFDNEHEIIATADPYNFNKGTSSQLLAINPDGSTPSVSVFWTPDMFLEPSNQVFDPVATPDSTIIYTVYSEDEFGCDASDTVRLNMTCICDEPYLYIPNAFSPNGDNLNENFNLIAQPVLLEDYYLAVYNRWGELVFETTDLNVSWDGTFNGTLVNPDVYGFYLRVKCFGVEEEFTRRGNVSVLY
ncbi:MAG TPA: gliding motility-associated C-terminal domain-containing protein [Saprospiraceae bacterium]|nr:gliding motility-associated C-terminal domain-containing protein [Saprospiraceae bacterium]